MKQEAVMMRKGSYDEEAPEEQFRAIWLCKLLYQAKAESRLKEQA